MDAQEIAPVAIRPLEADDRAFILATWLRSFRHGSPFARRLTNDVFFTNHHPLATAILDRADTLVAVLEDDPTVIIGYLVSERGTPPVLHFAYTKKEFRRMRVFSQLMDEAGLPEVFEVSHPTFDWLEFMAARFPSSRSNPYRQRLNDAA